MSWPPPVGKFAGPVGVSAATAWLAKLATASKSNVVVVALAAITVASIIAVCLPKIIDSLARRRQTIIREKKTAEFVDKEAETRHQIAMAGLNPEKTDSAKEMLRSLAVNPVVPKEQQRSDATYREWLSSNKPSVRSPGKPRSVRRKPWPSKGSHVVRGEPDLSETETAIAQAETVVAEAAKTAIVEVAETVAAEAAEGD
jgi:hypothetical protein